MRDKLLTYAIGISVVAHIAAVCVVGQTSASRLANAPSHEPEQPKFVEVELVDLSEPPKPKLEPEIFEQPEPEQVVEKEPVFVPTPKPQPEPRHIERERSRPDPAPKPRKETPKKLDKPSSPRPAPRVASAQPAGNPGGKLNVGSTSRQGDLPGDWSGGTTPVGWVPGDKNGKGKGSGSGKGIGTPDPPKHADDGPGLKPAPAPPPEPKKVSMKVCDASGLLPGEHCKGTRSAIFVEGDEPGRRCNHCKAPEPKHKSRLAEQTKPVLIKDHTPKVSIDNPCTVRVSYTITENGDVTDVQVIQSSGNKAVDKAVVYAAGKMKYKPATQDGKPRSVKISRTYSFR